MSAAILTQYTQGSYLRYSCVWIIKRSTVFKLEHWLPESNMAWILFGKRGTPDNIMIHGLAVRKIRTSQTELISIKRDWINHFTFNPLQNNQLRLHKCAASVYKTTNTRTARWDVACLFIFILVISCWNQAVGIPTFTRVDHTIIPSNYTLQQCSV
jgi:hypothetical protein